MSATYGFKYWFGNPKLHIYKDKFFRKISENVSNKMFSFTL